MHAVREKDVAFILPGTAFASTATLRDVAAEAARKEEESLQEALMALSWEMSEPGAMYTVAGEEGGGGRAGEGVAEDRMRPRPLDSGH